MSFEAAVAARREAVEETLNNLLPPEQEPPTVIHRAMRYSACCSGKRLRAVLAMAAAEAVGGKLQQALPVAAALEMIHAYSLIHDDLPAMDDDDYRRGKPTNHKVFGEGIAVLAGDALLTHAFGILAGLPSSSGIAADVTVRILQEAAAACGTGGLIGGQVADLESEGRSDLDLETLQAIHARKTGALFSISLRAGALVAGGSPAQLEALTAYARELGLAFQIVDDVLNVEGDAQTLGKAVGSDERRLKATYPSLLGLEQSKIMARKGVERAQQALDPLGEPAWLLREVADYVVERDR